MRIASEPVGGHRVAAMRKRRVLLGALFLAVAVVVGVLLALVGSMEPSYGGKRLSEWVEDIGLAYQAGQAGVRPHDGGVATALDAVQHIGTNAIPFLLKWIPYEMPQWRIKLIKRFERRRQRPVGPWLRNDPRIIRADEAVRALGVFGAQAEPAVEPLSRAMDDTNAIWSASERRRLW